ncbi:TPR repeat protein [Pseudorhizobium tarimense]|uniref:TPR repeat protein n=2 Tax=Pseudorhizobium tarimense TaxID=1079109 RepID=A0ABV2H6F7_9HYPH
MYFVFSKLSILFRRLFENSADTVLIKRAGKSAAGWINRPLEDGDPPDPKGKTGISTTQVQTGTKPMARFEMQNTEYATMGGESRAEAFCNMGLMYATGRGCAVDLVSAHKWLNIAAIKGSDRAAELRQDLAQTMSKAELAAALRAAREWMTMH